MPTVPLSDRCWWVISGARISLSLANDPLFILSFLLGPFICFQSSVCFQSVWPGHLITSLSNLHSCHSLKSCLGQVYSPAYWNVPSFSVRFHECLVIGILNFRGTSSLQPIEVMSELPRMWNCSMGQPKTTGPIPSWEETLLAKLGRQTNGQTNQGVPPTHMQTNLDAR